MKAIQTHYVGPTNFRGSRIIAKAEGVKPLTIGYDHASDNPHREAAEKLCARQGWQGRLIEGNLPNGDSVFVFADR